MNIPTTKTCPALKETPPVEEIPFISMHGEEIRLQFNVLKILSGGNNDIVMQLINKISPELRTIITDFEKRDGRLPTADDVIWIIGEHHKVDPRYVDRLLEDKIDTASARTVKEAIQEHQASRNQESGVSGQ